MEVCVSGIVVGQSIQLTAPLGLKDGQKVEIVVKVPIPAKSEWGEGLKRCAGAMEPYWSDEDDRILAEIQRARGTNRRLPAE